MSVATLKHDTTTTDVLALSIEERADILADEGAAIETAYAEWQESTTAANSAQLAAGARLAIVKSLASVLFTDDEGEELSKRGQDAAYVAWYREQGLTKDFVSRALAAHELAEIIGEDAAAELNSEHVKQLAPVAFEQTAGGKLRKLEVREANVSKVLRKAEELADTDGVSVAGRHIRAARAMTNIAAPEERSTERALKVRTVVRAAAMTDTTVLDFSGVTNEDMDALANFLTIAQREWETRQAELAEASAEEDSDN